MRKEVYLAGGISGMTFSMVNNWREEVSKVLKTYDINARSPMRGKSKPVDSESIYNTFEQTELQKTLDYQKFAKEINHRDYFDVKVCDAVFVNLLGIKTVSIGTVMEVAWARAFEKPVVLVMEDEGNLHEHALFTYACGFRANNIQDGIELLLQVLAI